VILYSLEISSVYVRIEKYTKDLDNGAVGARISRELPSNERRYHCSLDGKAAPAFRYATSGSSSSSWRDLDMVQRIRKQH